MKSKRTRRTVRVSRTGTRLLRLTILTAFVVTFMACSATSKISVKQNQGEQNQEIDIQHEGKLQNLSLIFNTTPLYGCSQE